MASHLPYADKRLYDVTMAMRIGKEYLAHKVARADWIQLAHACKLPQKHVLERLESLLARIADAAEAVAVRAITDGLLERTVNPLTERIVERSRECRKMTAGGIAGS